MADYLPQASTGQTGQGHEANTLVVKGLVDLCGVPCSASESLSNTGSGFVMKDFSQRGEKPGSARSATFPDDIRHTSRSATSGRTTHRFGQVQGGRA